MDNAYVHGLRQHDSRPRSPVIVPHDMSALRKKILFENTLLEERTLHEFSAGKGDGAGVDTGSAPLKPLTSPTPTRTPTPTPTPTPAPAGIPVASTTIINISIVSSGFNDNFVKSINSSGYTWYSTELTFEFQGYPYKQWYVRDAESSVYTINTSPNQTVDYIPLAGWSPADTTVTVVA